MVQNNEKIIGFTVLVSLFMFSVIRHLDCKMMFMIAVHCHAESYSSVASKARRTKAALTRLQEMSGLCVRMQKV